MNSTMLVAMDDMIADIANSTIVFENGWTLFFYTIFEAIRFNATTADWVPSVWNGTFGKYNLRA